MRFYAFSFVIFYFMLKIQVLFLFLKRIRK
jgi:hypothetical protein